MNKKALIHSVVLVAAVVLAFFWVSDKTLDYYSLQLTAALLITLILTHHLLKPATFKLVESTVSTIAVLLVTTATGGAASPLFFLNYLLLFELSLLLEPVIPVVLSVMLMAFYFYTHEIERSWPTLFILFAFPLMTPLAYFLGQLYKKVKNQKKEIQGLERKVEELEEELVEEELK